MSRLNDDKREVLAYIDAIMTMIEKYPKMGIGEGSNGINLSASMNPFNFLMDIISKKVSDSEMIDWLVGILTKSLPAIELGVKGILLSNLKQTIDCNNDPWIPEWIRMLPNNSTLGKPIDKNKGLIINLKSIDYSNILSYSPLSNVGQMKYFGTKKYYKFNVNGLDDVKYYSYYDGVMAIEKLHKKAEKDPNHVVVPTINNLVKCCEIDNVYELARANDFNAFLWFVINKAKFQNNKTLGTPLEYKIEEGKGTYEFSESKTVLGKIKGTFQPTGNYSTPFAPGSTIMQKYGNLEYNVVSLCTKMTVNSNYQYSGGMSTMGSVADMQSAKKNSYEMNFIPVSHNLDSANWYTNSGTFFNFLLPEKSRKHRDYNEDFPICNLKLLVGDDLLDNKINGVDFSPITDETYVKLTVLPKPLIHYPRMKFESDKPFKNVGEPFWRYKKLLFNENGEPDNKGHYTVTLKSSDSIEDDDTGKITTYTLLHDSTVIVNWEDGSYVLSGDNKLLELIECYPGLTVYDFNYNFVMGMQLFEPSVVASQLIELVTNITMFGGVGANVSVNRSETLYQMRVAEIVKNIVESTAYEASDCFYSFSNQKYNEMLRKSELKRAKAYPFSTSSNQASMPSLDEAYSILQGFDSDSNLNETKTVLTRAFTQATANITDEILPEDRYSIKLNIIQEMIKGLVMVIVNSLLTPKIVLLFEVNRQLMEGHDEHLSIEDFIESISGLITDIVIEIRDMILNALLDWAKDILMEFISKMATILTLEQAQYYARLMSSLFKACSFKVSHRKALESQLDNVDYADIDEVEQPIIKDC